MLTKAGLCLLTFVALLCAPSAHAAFPGANGRLAYGGYGYANGDYISGIYTMNTDASNGTLLTPDLWPKWSPDGRQIVFQRSGADEIAKVNADGSGLTPLGAGVSPSWSPDGKRIVFTDISGGLSVMNADGSGVTPVLTSSARWPAWSPLGDRIAYTSGGGDLRLVAPDGSGDTSLTPDMTAGRADWSPDGQWIVFNGIPYGVGALYVIKADGSEFVPLDIGGFSDADSEWIVDRPVFSPDGRQILYWVRGCSFEDCHFRRYYHSLFTRGVDGSCCDVAITRPPADLSFESGHDWQPLMDLGPNPYPRPGSATPLRVPLAPAYEQCTAANSTHVAPLTLPSCTPPVQQSGLLTSFHAGRGSAFVRLSAIVGDPATPTDEEDLAIAVRATDVVRQSDGADYTGQVILALSARITDKRNGFGGVPGTMSDTQLGWPVDCVANPGVAGGTCALTTTAEALVPNLFLERKRAIVSLPAIRVLDLGPNGTGVGSSCPPTCGDGDEDTYLEQALFAP